MYSFFYDRYLVKPHSQTDSNKPIGSQDQLPLFCSGFSLLINVDSVRYLFASSFFLSLKARPEVFQGAVFSLILKCFTEYIIIIIIFKFIFQTVIINRIIIIATVFTKSYYFYSLKFLSNLVSAYGKYLLDDYI